MSSLHLVAVDKVEPFFCLLLVKLSWNSLGAFAGENWLPNNPKPQLNNDLWI
jgi:hypothetical protein